MDSYKVIITDRAQEQLEEYIDYIQLTLLNHQAAMSVWQDAVNTGQQLSMMAGSLPLCRHPALRERGYRRIHVCNHRYTMIYRVEGSVAYVEAIYHQLQDYENTFADEIDGQETW